jgi:transcription initiation factor IIE alpha subunit
MLFTVEKPRQRTGLRIVEETPDEGEASLLRALYQEGQLWDEQVDRETRRMLRRLEAIGLVECRTLIDKRSFWAVSIKGLRLLGGEEP